MRKNFCSTCTVTSERLTYKKENVVIYQRICITGPEEKSIMQKDIIHFT